MTIYYSYFFETNGRTYFGNSQDDKTEVASQMNCYDEVLKANNPKIENKKLVHFHLLGKIYEIL